MSHHTTKFANRFLGSDPAGLSASLGEHGDEQRQADQKKLHLARRVHRPQSEQDWCRAVYVFGIAP